MRSTGRWAAAGVGIAVAAAWLAAGAPAEAQGRRGRGPGWDQGRLVARLDLTADQARKVANLRAEHRKGQIQRRAALRVAQIELGELLGAAKLDEAAIKAKAHEIGDMQAAQLRARVEHRLAVAQVLTPEQRERARGLLAVGRGGRLGRHGWGDDRPWGRRPRFGRGWAGYWE
jgi:Spy/CpxP family protein refolding chaperone